MSRFFFLIATPFLISQWAAAASPKSLIVCQSVGTIEGEIETGECNDNKHFGQAGLDCLKAFRARVKSNSIQAQKQLSASNADQVGKAGNAQTHDFSGSSADYAISQQTLADLIAAAEAAHATVDSYLKHLYFPEDFDAPEEIIGDRMEFLDSNGCYSENERGLKDILKQMDKDIADLKATKSASQARETTSSQRRGSFDSLNASAMAGASGQGEGAAVVPVPNGKSKNGDSTITGVKKKSGP